MSGKPWIDTASGAAVPHYQRNQESDVWVPTFQAGIIALGVGALSSVGLLLLMVVGSMTWVQVCSWPVALGVLVALGVFIWQAWGGFSLRRALWLAEAGFGVDLDGDGKRGKPERPIIVNVAGAGQRVPIDGAGDAAPPPAVCSPRDDLYVFLLRCYTAGPGRSAWLRPGQERLTLPSGLEVTRGVYDGYMADLGAAGICVKNGSGWETAVPIETAMTAAGLMGCWSADGRPAETRQIEAGR